MVLDEEEIRNNKADCIIDFKEELKPTEANSVSPVYKIPLGEFAFIRKYLRFAKYLPTFIQNLSVTSPTVDSMGIFLCENVYSNQWRETNDPDILILLE